MRMPSENISQNTLVGPTKGSRPNSNSGTCSGSLPPIADFAISKIPSSGVRSPEAPPYSFPGMGVRSLPGRTGNTKGSRISGFSGWLFVRGYWPENGKVGNESLSARSDLAIGDAISMFYFQGVSPVLGLRGFPGNPGSGARPVQFSSVQLSQLN